MICYLGSQRVHLYDDLGKFQGCIEAIKDWAKEKTAILIGVGIGIACLEVSSTPLGDRKKNWQQTKRNKTCTLFSGQGP